MAEAKKIQIQWSIKNFEELSLLELYGLLKLRTDIFVVEQECAYPELDGDDPNCIHLIGVDKTGKIVATARLVPSEKAKERHIGRVAVSKDHRGQGLGVEVMTKAIDYCRQKLNASRIEVAAQLYLKKFYEDLGFQQTSEVYKWDGIDHLDMELKTS
jgi:ElaA protein